VLPDPKAALHEWRAAGQFQGLNANRRPGRRLRVLERSKAGRNRTGLLVRLTPVGHMIESRPGFPLKPGTTFDLIRRLEPQDQVTTERELIVVVAVVIRFRGSATLLPVISHFRTQQQAVIDLVVQTHCDSLVAGTHGSQVTAGTCRTTGNLRSVVIPEPFVTDARSNFVRHLMEQVGVDSVPFSVRTCVGSVTILDTTIVLQNQGCAI